MLASPIFNVPKIFQYHGEPLTTENALILPFTNARWSEENQILDIIDIRELATRRAKV